MRLLGSLQGTRATTCTRWALIAALRYGADPTKGAYIATHGVATYASPARKKDFGLCLVRHL